MKYLRRMFETKGLNKESIEDMIKTYMSYVIDDGFKCEYVSYPMDYLKPQGNYTGIRILLNTKVDESFTWERIKYDLIPFLSVLKDSFIIEHITINRLDRMGDVKVSLDYLLDEHTVENNIYSIKISLK